MAAKTFYLKNTAVNGFGSLSETDPGASTTVTGWTVAKVAATRFQIMLFGTEQASANLTTTDDLATPAAPSSGDSWRSENPINGSFANANWTLSFKFRAITTASSQAGRIKCRLWRSANADGSGATQITSATLTGTTTVAITTSADASSTVTFSPGGIITLTNEYLFVQCEWEITTASGSTTGDVLFRAGTAATVVTSDFTIGPVTGNLSSSEADDTLSSDADVAISGALSSTEADDAISATVQAIISAALSATEADDTLSSAGTVADPPVVVSVPAAALLMGP